MARRGLAELDQRRPPGASFVLYFSERFNLPPSVLISQITADVRVRWQSLILAMASVDGTSRSHGTLVPVRPRARKFFLVRERSPTAGLVFLCDFSSATPRMLPVSKSSVASKVPLP